MDKEEGEVVAMGSVEIDTRVPFKSVKAAVSLFGERVLAGEIYAKQLREISKRRKEASETAGSAQSKIAALASELEEAKQSLEKAKEEANSMTYRIKSLKEEPEQTKKELREVKARELILLQRREDPEIENLKFIENIPTKEQLKAEEAKEFQKKRYVKFASPPALARVIVNKKDIEQLERPPSMKKPKGKAIIPVIGWLFARRKGSTQEVDSPRI